MPTLVACLSARNHADQPYRVPTCLAARKAIRGPKGQGNQQLISAAPAQTCPLTANSGLTYERRTTVNWVDFLGQVEAWIDPSVERVYAVQGNLNIHSAPDVLLFSLLHPRWEFVFQPKYAA